MGGRGLCTVLDATKTDTRLGGRFTKQFFSGVRATTAGVLVVGPLREGRLAIFVLPSTPMFCLLFLNQCF